MRKTFVKCKAYNTAKRHCPWAAVVARAVCGFWCFESIADYKVWKNQK